MSNKYAILVDGEKYNGELSLTASHNRSCRLPLDGVPHYAVTPDVYPAPGVKPSEKEEEQEHEQGQTQEEQETQENIDDGLSNLTLVGDSRSNNQSQDISLVGANDSDSNLKVNDTGGDFTKNTLEVDPNVTISLREFLSGQTLPPDFQEKFAAFAYLRTRGYFMMPGLRFGGTYVAYPGDPLQFHSHLIVKVLGENKKFNLIELVTSGRLATAVKKAWVVMGKDTKSTEQTLADPDGISPAPTRAYSIEWAGFG